jgi:hypothetical protein
MFKISITRVPYTPISDVRVAAMLVGFLYETESNVINTGYHLSSWRSHQAK